MKLLQYIEDFFFPPACLFCHNPLAMGTRPLICPDCETKYEAFNGKCCRCNTPLSFTDTEVHCNTCRSAKRPFDAVISSYFYEEEVRRAIIEHKFNFMFNNAKQLSEHISEIICQVFHHRPDCLVIVPSSKKRVFERGYDHLLEIAEFVSKNTNTPLVQNILQKVKDTPHQSETTSRLQRFRNIRGAFSVRDKEFFRGKSIILFDDVYTTGATTYECAKVLRRAGARQIIIATVAISDQFRR